MLVLLTVCALPCRQDEAAAVSRRFQDALDASQRESDAAAGRISTAIWATQVLVIARALWQPRLLHLCWSFTVQTAQASVTLLTC